MTSANAIAQKIARAYAHARNECIRQQMHWSVERSDILNSRALAAEVGKVRLRIAEIVTLSKAIELIKAIESGRMFGGKGLVSMD